MFQQDQSLNARVLVKHFHGFFRQIKTGHDVRYVSHAIAKHLLRNIQAVRCVGNRDNRIGMGVVNKLGWQKSMQQRFDGWIGRARVQQVDALRIDHFLVTELFELGHAQ